MCKIKFINKKQITVAINKKYIYIKIKNDKIYIKMQNLPKFRQLNSVLNNSNFVIKI